MKQETLMEFSRALQKLQTAFDKMEKEELERSTTDQLDNILTMAQNAPICGHILSRTNTYNQGSYLRLLAAGINLTKSNELRMAQLVFFSRIVITMKNNFSIETLLLEAMTFGTDDLIRFKEDMTKIQCYYFMVDLFVLIFLRGNPEEAHLHYAAELVSFLNISKESINDIMTAVKAILTQRTRGLSKLSYQMTAKLKDYFPHNVFEAFRKASAGKRTDRSPPNH